MASFTKSIEALGEPGAALAHADAVQALPELARRAVHVIARPATKAEAKVARVHRLFAAMRHGEDLYAVKLTVKEFKSGGGALVVDGVEKLHKLYDASLEKRIPATGSAQGEPITGASSSAAPKTAPLKGAEAIGPEDAIILRDLLRGIKGDDGKFLAQVVGGKTRAAVELGDDFARMFFGPDADASAIVHESGHVFVQLLRRLGTEGAEPNAAAARDWGTLRGWLGADKAAPLTRDQHEQFAQAFERYLAEGAAPSLELVPVFERFKAWMLGIYRALNAIAPEIPAEVRAVFEAMLATDEQRARLREASLGETGRDVFADSGSAPAFDPGPERIEDLARTMGLDTASELDAGVAMLADAGRLSAADAAALAEADALIARTDVYARAYKAAATCLTGAA